MACWCYGLLGGAVGIYGLAELQRPGALQLVVVVIVQLVVAHHVNDLLSGLLLGGIAGVHGIGLSHGAQRRGVVVALHVPFLDGARQLAGRGDLEEVVLGSNSVVEACQLPLQQRRKCAERGCKALETAFHTQIEVNVVIVTFFPDNVIGFCLQSVR